MVFCYVLSEYKVKRNGNFGGIVKEIVQGKGVEFSIKNSKYFKKTICERSA